MKPGDHPDFFRFAPPSGSSRESDISIDRDGHFWHEGARVVSPALARALASWVGVHPDDGRFILTNGYDWCYVRVDDAPFVVTSLRVDGGGTLRLALSDESEELLDAATMSLGDDDVVYARAKSGRFEARFSRHAQLALAPFLVEADPPTLRVAGRDHRLGRRSA